MTWRGQGGSRVATEGEKEAPNGNGPLGLCIKVLGNRGGKPGKRGNDKEKERGRGRDIGGTGRQAPKSPLPLASLWTPHGLVSRGLSFFFFCLQTGCPSEKPGMNHFMFSSLRVGTTG